MSINLLTVVDYLYQNHDRMFILPGQNGALVYDPMTDEVIIIWGDFTGSLEEQQAELQIAMQRHRAWIQ